MLPFLNEQRFIYGICRRQVYLELGRLCSRCGHYICVSAITASCGGCVPDGRRSSATSKVSGTNSASCSRAAGAAAAAAVVGAVVVVVIVVVVVTSAADPLGLCVGIVAIVPRPAMDAAIDIDAAVVVVVVPVHVVVLGCVPRPACSDPSAAGRLDAVLRCSARPSSSLVIIRLC